MKNWYFSQAKPMAQSIGHLRVFEKPGQWTTASLTTTA
jgi:hypothetical protein